MSTAQHVAADPVQQIRIACDYLRAARNLLRQAGARRSTAKVRRALKSAEGAERNAVCRRWDREEARRFGNTE